MKAGADSEPKDLGALAKRLGADFEDEDLFLSALTHRSYAFEQGSLPHNERLEFLGDAVLGLAVTDLIYSNFPDLPEGEMAKLRAGIVNMAVLADVARELNLGDHLLLGRGEERSGGRNKTSILADALEAVIGTVYLEKGPAEASSVVRRLFFPRIRDHVERGSVRDFKTTLQEQAVRAKGRLPEYRIISTGPDHAKRFSAKVYLDGTLLGEGKGRSKKEAEQAAAQLALEKLEADV